MHLLVEGPGERAFFRTDRPSWGRRFFAGFRGCQVTVHQHGGRGVLPVGDLATHKARDRSNALLDVLPAKLRACAESRDAMGLLDKVAWAERMGVEMSLDEAGNRSPSFRALCVGLGRELSPARTFAAAPATPSPARRRFRHTAKETSQ